MAQQPKVLSRPPTFFIYEGVGVRLAGGPGIRRGCGGTGRRGTLKKSGSPDHVGSNPTARTTVLSQDIPDSCLKALWTGQRRLGADSYGRGGASVDLGAFR